MAVRDDVVARNWLVGVELTNWRASADLTQADLASRLGVSRPLVSQFELGRTPPSTQQITAVLLECGATNEEVERLTAFAAQPAGRNWLKPWENVIKPGMRRFFGAEGFASDEFFFAVQVLPGLIQTARYASGMTSKSARVRPDQESAHVDLRLARQRRVLDGDLNLTVVIEEAILDRPAGPPEVMAEQLEFLVNLAAQDNVTILVLPTSIGRHEALEGRFVMLQFNNDLKEPIAGPVVCVELLKNAVYETAQDQIAAYRNVSRHTLTSALAQDESIALIGERRARLVG